MTLRNWKVDSFCLPFSLYIFNTGGVTPLRLNASKHTSKKSERKHIKLTFDEQTLSDYDRYYFSIHTKATNRPIARPYHESINQWMIMKRPMMNALKNKWKDFIVWFIEQQGYTNLRIEKCELIFTTYFNTNRRHDVDNTCPKFILDGLCESGFIIDDDSGHIQKLTLMCGIDREHPRTEIDVYYWNNKEDIQNGKREENSY